MLEVGERDVSVDLGRPFCAKPFQCPASVHYLDNVGEKFAVGLADLHARSSTNLLTRKSYITFTLPRRPGRPMRTFVTTISASFSSKLLR